MKKPKKIFNSTGKIIYAYFRLHLEGVFGLDFGPLTSSAADPAPNEGGYGRDRSHRHRGYKNRDKTEKTNGKLKKVKGNVHKLE